jgi:mannose/fructose/N-acetylgalactosamine-specific phosphotransferase system component IIC
MNFLEFTLDFLEEILLVLSLIFFVIFGFMISAKIGILFISLSLFALAISTIKYKRQMAEDD